MVRFNTRAGIRFHIRAVDVEPEEPRRVVGDWNAILGG